MPLLICFYQVTCFCKLLIENFAVLFSLLQAEQVSLHGFINMFLVISLALVWAVLPSDLLAIGAHWLQNRILVVSINLKLF